MASKLLFTFRHPPYGTSTAREGIEALLAAAVYDQVISVLFIGDGVFQLLRNPMTPSSPGQRQDKNLSRMLDALPIYGIDRVYAHEASLAVRGLRETDLTLAPQLIDDEQTRALMVEHEQLLSF